MLKCLFNPTKQSKAVVQQEIPSCLLLFIQLQYPWSFAKINTEIKTVVKLLRGTAFVWDNLLFLVRKQCCFALVFPQFEFASILNGYVERPNDKLIFTSH